MSIPDSMFNRFDGRLGLPSYKVGPEELLSLRFHTFLREIAFTDVMKPCRGHRLPEVSNFRFVPVEQTRRGGPSLHRAGYDVKLPRGVKATYTDPNDPSHTNGLPYLDTRQAIGLTKSAQGVPRLIAVAGFGVDEAGRMKIVQLQDVTGVRKADNPEAFRTTGLREGFLWRHTLVEACEALAGRLGCSEIVIPSHTESKWKAVQRYGYPGLDGVAETLGYSPSGAEWIKELIPTYGTASRR